MGVDAMMRVELSEALSDKEIMQAAGDLVERFGTSPFFLDRAGKYGKPQHALERDDENPKALRVNLGYRYYGPGYERGDGWLFVGIARFLEQRLKGRVFYGGDSSDELSPFGEQEREALAAHFIENGHVPYNSYFGRRVTAMPTCAFCGDRPLIDHGGGQGVSFLSCHGCGQNFHLHGDGRCEEVEKFW